MNVDRKLPAEAPSKILLAAAAISLRAKNALGRDGKLAYVGPVAWATALAMAGDGVFMTTSPIDLAPNGPVGSKLGSKAMRICGISRRVGSLYVMNERPRTL